MTTVYCLSGLGADRRIFSRISWEGIEVQYLDWLMPLPAESIQDYAGRMCEQVREEEAVLIGVSFGGMMAIEMAKHKHFGKIILVSSVRNRSELPAWMKLTGRLRLQQLMPPDKLLAFKLARYVEPLENFFLGAVSQEEKALANAFRREVDKQYLRWAIHQVLEWKNDWEPVNLYHIHGDRDRIFPIGKLRPTHVLKGGTHFMVYGEAGKMIGLLKEIIGG